MGSGARVAVSTNDSRGRQFFFSFLNQTDHVSKRHILHAISLIYLAYAIRAFRWKIFLRPVRKTSTSQMLAPTVIGFTGLALLGRPGELIRPYLISRRLNLPFSSQLAVWAVERIFDIAAFTLLLVLTAFVATAPKRLDTYELFQKVSLAFALLSGVLIVAAIATHRSGEALAGGWSGVSPISRPTSAIASRSAFASFTPALTPSAVSGRCWP